MEELSYYLNRITSSHADKPNFVGMMAALIEPFIHAQDLLAELLTAFDIDTATGVQLDVVGQWVGIARQIAQPISGVFFSFDTASLGFDRGVWKGPFDPDTGLINLDDELYRALLKAKVIMNGWDGTIDTIARALSALFQNQSTTGIVVLDNQDMTMTVGISGALPSSVALSMLEGNYVPIKPSGVRINYVVTSIDSTALFGFDINNNAIAGFDIGAWQGVPGEMPGQVVGLSVLSASANTVTLTWTAITTGTAPFIYQLLYQPASAPGVWIAQSVPTYVPKGLIYNLIPNTKYNFQVYARNSAGPGLPSATVSYTTPAAPPGAVQGLVAG